jgi:hypothetical protein
MLPLTGCGWLGRAERPAWRTQAENYCLSRGLVKPSAYVEPAAEIDGPGICGLTHPFRVTALFDGKLPLNKAVTLDCSMIPALEQWVADTVEPAAQARFSARVVELETFGAYSCRSVDNLAGAQLSEHSFGNAIDISGFKLEDGREISIVGDWKRPNSQESAFLREAHAGACQQFTTVLGPGADVFHYNHFHLDLAMHGSTNTGPRRYCRPNPPPELMPPPAHPDGLPPAPDIDEPMDISRAGPQPPRFSSQPLDLHGLIASLPPPVEPYAKPSMPPAPPDKADIDNSPTSSVDVSHDD